MITLAEAQGAGGSFVHKAPNQKTDMSQKRVDLLSTQMSVDFLSTLDPLAEARGGIFLHKVPNQKKDMTQMRRRLAAVCVDSMVKYNCDDTCYFSNSDSQLSCIYTAYTSLACVAFATILHCQTLATCQTTTWLVVTRPAAGHPSSVLSRAFHQSNSAILAICPHTLAGCVL